MRISFAKYLCSSLLTLVLCLGYCFSESSANVDETDQQIGVVQSDDDMELESSEGEPQPEEMTFEESTGALTDDDVQSESRPTTVSGGTVQGFKIVGNHRIERQTILSRISVQVGDSFNDDTLDQVTKDLFNTGYFADEPGTISVSRSGNVIVINVRENPIINRIAYEGNKKIKDRILKEEVRLRPRMVLSHHSVEAARQHILEIYRRTGRFSATVEPKIIRLPQNRVDLVFEINEGAVTFVRKINFIGNKRYSNNVLEEQMLTKRKKWYRFFANDDTYDPDRFQADQQMLKEFYYNSGFPRFRILSAVAELAPDHQGFFLTINLREGDRYKFGKISFVSSVPQVNTTKLKEQITFTEGDWFSGKSLENSVDKISNIVGTRGYAFAQIDPKITINDKTKTVDVAFTISEGPRVYIERIEISGNKRTRDYAIRRELQVHEGDAYNDAKVKKSEKRLMNLGFFKTVDITTRPGSAPDRTVLVVRTEEQSTGELRFGIGYSTMDRGLITARYSEDNFMGKGQNVYGDIRLAQRKQDFDVGFVEPYFMGRQLAAGVNVFHSIDKRVRVYDQRTTGFTLTLGYFLSEHWSQTLNYTLAVDEIRNISKDASATLKAQKGSKITSAIGQTISYDRRDNPFSPTEGYIISLSNTFAGLGGNIRYLSNVLSGVWYYPVTDEIVWSNRGSIGAMLRLGKDIRVVDSYLLGADSFKGFEYGGVGPHDIVTKDPLGGTRFWKVKSQVTFPVGLPKDFGVKGALHITAGSLWKIGRKTSNLARKRFIGDDNSMRVSAGGGLTWRSPFGPISIDYTKVITKKGYDRAQAFLVSFSTRS